MLDYDEMPVHPDIGFYGDTRTANGSSTRCLTTTNPNVGRAHSMCRSIGRDRPLLLLQREGLGAASIAIVLLQDGENSR